MKPMIQLSLLLGLLCLVQCVPFKALRDVEIYDRQRISYRQLYEDPRFQEPLRFSDLDYPRLHAAMFYATNAVRVRRGAAPLTYHGLLEKAAWRYASRMVEKNFMAHEDPYAAHLRTAEQRARATGVTNAILAENLASYFGIQYRVLITLSAKCSIWLANLLDVGERRAVPSSGGLTWPRRKGMARRAPTGGRCHDRGQYRRRERVYVLPGRRGQFSRTPNGQPIPNHTYRSFAEAVIDFWMSSPKHRENLLAKEALQLGCGAAFFRDDQGFPKFKLVQVFQWYEPVRS